MKKLKITRYSDGGHSWFKVPRKLLTELNIEEKISSFSYQLGDFVYLEEDCDIAIFFKAYLKTDTLSWEMMTSVADITEKHTNNSSRIRNYPRFVPGFKRVEWQEGKRVKLYGKEYTMVNHYGKKALNDGLRTYSFKPSQLDEMFTLE
jgi:hypothetical protein